MSTALGNELPQELIDDLSARNLPAKWSKTIPLVTIDANGFPHFAILSYGEIVATGPRELRLGLYPNSSTTRNIQARPNVALLIVSRDAVYYVKGAAVEKPAEGLVRFDVSVEAVLVDNEPGARITSGIGFEMSQGKDWWLGQSEKNLAALR
ncbi:MAG: pyridoxamine 5'-phosphate oxidase family protein [Chloroflexi bacterium]|nr:pyridoxamine 5'-phosphate oxidase family protein [Chloroflexota bacterium]